MPDEYISRKAAAKLLGYTFGVDVVRKLHEVPAAAVAEVVYGKWENGNPICPVCGENKFKDLDADIWCDWQPDFCPNCGAKMDGGFDDATS